MANLRNAIKQIRKDEKKAYQNLMIKSGIRTAIKKVRKAIDSDEKTVDEQIKAIQKLLDKAVKRNIFKKNNVARKLSRLYAYKKKAQTK